MSEMTYVEDLVRVLFPYGQSGAAKQAVLSAARARREDRGETIPETFDEAVQAELFTKFCGFVCNIGKYGHCFPVVLDPTDEIYAAHDIHHGIMEYLDGAGLVHYGGVSHNDLSLQKGDTMTPRRPSLSVFPWSRWQAFPDPRSGGILTAPFGPGVYELRNRKTNELVLFGRSKNVASRMSSLLPAPLGAGKRNNKEKRIYVDTHLSDIDYRTKPCVDPDTAKMEEKRLRENRHRYIFLT